jgi:hypothetical protein
MYMLSVYCVVLSITTLYIKVMNRRSKRSDLLFYLPLTVFWTVFHTFISTGECTYSEQGSSVSIVSGYRLDDRAIQVRSPAETKDFSSNL